MAVKKLTIELLESNTFIELEAEETMQLRIIISKLRSLGHLVNDEDYYIRKPDGNIVWEGDPVRSCKSDVLVFTTNKEWKPELLSSGGFADAKEIDEEVVLNEGTCWIMPFLDKALWNDFNGGAHLFLLENITLADGNIINIRVLVQYSVINLQVVNSVNSAECANRMQQVLANVINNELSRTHLTLGSLYNLSGDLAINMRYFLTTHTELKWGIRIDSVILLGIDINT